jgi:hypothetical protein
MPGGQWPLFSGRSIAIAQAPHYGGCQHQDPSGKENQDEHEQHVE